MTKHHKTLDNCQAATSFCTLFGYQTNLVLQMKGLSIKGYPINKFRNQGFYKVLPTHCASIFTKIFRGASIVDFTLSLGRFSYGCYERYQLKSTDVTALKASLRKNTWQLADTGTKVVRSGLMFASMLLSWIGAAAALTVGPWLLVGSMALGALKSLIEFVKAIVNFCKQPSFANGKEIAYCAGKTATYALFLAVTIMIILATAAVLSNPVGGPAFFAALVAFIAKYPLISKLSLAATATAIGTVMIKPFLNMLNYLRKTFGGKSAEKTLKKDPSVSSAEEQTTIENPGTDVTADAAPTTSHSPTSVSADAGTLDTMVIRR